MLKRLQLRNVVLCFCIFWGSLAFGETETLTEKEKGENALQLINHFSTVLYRITDSRDLALLELEYDRISQENIKLNEIDDVETIEIIKQIMRYITRQRINSEEREKLQKWLKEDLRNAVFEAFPNPTGLISANPRVIANVIGQFAFSWYFHYMGARKRLQREFEKQEWELDKQQITYLNERNMKLIELYWQLVKKYDIKDAFRITTKEIKDFVEYADKDDNESRVFKTLCLPQNEEKYKKFPEYWYRRGRAAENVREPKEAIKAYRQYQAIYFNFLKQDHIAAEVALNLAKLMIDSGDYEKADMMRQLDIIEKNVDADDWTYLYFCGSHYMTLGEYQLAKNVLEKATRQQEHILSFSYKEFLEKLKAKGKLGFLNYPQQGSYQLMTCRYAYLQACSKELDKEALGKEFSEICKDKMTSGFETMTYADCLYKNLPVELWVNLYNIVAYPDGDIDFRLPMNWFYLGNEDTYLDLTGKNHRENVSRLLKTTIITYSTTEEPKVYTEDVRDRKFRYEKDKKTGEENFWVNVETPITLKNIAKRNINRIELVLPLRGMTITLVYLARPDDVQLFPKNKEFYHPTSFKIDNVEYNFWNYR